MQSGLTRNTNSQQPMRYRLYIDESGDHTGSDPDHLGKRYLGLVTVSFETNAYRDFQENLEAFKKRHLEYDPDDPPTLHREDILHRKPPFHVLRDDRKRLEFNSDFLELVESASCFIIAVVIDKYYHGRRSYRTLTHPYHYCLHAVAERYCGRLRHFGCQGDMMAEARGGKEDHALKEVYRKIWGHGTKFMGPSAFQRVLTSKEIKLKNKQANVAGLQLADCLAHPLTRDVLLEYGIPIGKSDFGDRVREVIKPKYNRHLYQKHVKGYGKILLT